MDKLIVKIGLHRKPYIVRDGYQRCRLCPLKNCQASLSCTEEYISRVGGRCEEKVLVPVEFD